MRIRKKQSKRKNKKIYLKVKLYNGIVTTKVDRKNCSFQKVLKSKSFGKRKQIRGEIHQKNQECKQSEVYLLST
jgi:hypothetical protein